MLTMRFYRNLGFVLWIIALMALGAYNFGKLKLVYMLAINLLVIIGEMTLLLLSIRKVTKNRITNQSLSSNVLIPKGKFNDRQMCANTYIFKQPITSTNPMRKSVFRICIELAEKFVEPLEFSVIRIFERETSEQKVDATDYFVEGTHILHISVYPQEKLNFKFNRDIKAKLFSVDELYIP